MIRNLLATALMAVLFAVAVVRWVELDNRAICNDAAQRVAITKMAIDIQMPIDLESMIKYQRAKETMTFESCKRLWR